MLKHHRALLFSLACLALSATLASAQSPQVIRNEITFPDDAPVATPHLVEETGTLFEDSWAFSFGPTAGLLIGLGPFEVIAETQLRYMGGRSDAEWLDDDALRTINAETSRWSLPFLVGGRIRF